MTIEGIPFALALRGIRHVEVKRDAKGIRLAFMRRCSTQNLKPILVLHNNRAYDETERYAKFEIVGFEEVKNQVVNVGPWNLEEIGLSGNFCRHFDATKGPYIVYRLGKLLATNVPDAWKPMRESPSVLYWKELRNRELLKEGVTVRSFKKTLSYDASDKDRFLKEEEMRGATGTCDSCTKGKSLHISTF